MRRTTIATLAVLSIASFIAIATPRVIADPVDKRITQIKYSVEAGMCAGYCFSYLTVDPKNATLLLSGRNSERQSCPDLKFHADLNDATWKDVAGLVDRRSFTELPDVVGAPGATDYAIETLEVHFSDGTTKKVSFDRGNQPDSLKPITDKLGQLQAKLQPAARPQCTYK